MNKVCKKISIIAVCALGVGLVVGILGFVMGGAQSIVLEKNGFRVLSSADYEEVDYVDETFADVKSLKVDVDYFDKVILSEGSTFSVKGNNAKSLGGLDASLNAGTLTVSTKKSHGIQLFNFGFFTSKAVNSGTLEITYPSGATLDKVDLIIDLGNLEMYDLNADKIMLDVDTGKAYLERISASTLNGDMDLGDIEMKDADIKSSTIKCDTGQVKIKNIQSEGMDIDSNLGSVYVEGTLKGKNVFDIDTGDLELILNQSRGETSYFIDTDLGNVNIDGDNRFGSIENRVSGSTSDLHINSDLGDVKIMFNK